MGCAVSNEIREQQTQSRMIDKLLIVEPHSVIKLLLLGAGESGKSTILKQMRIIHDNGFTETELRDCTHIVYSNIVDSMVTLLYAMRRLNIEFELASNETEAEIVIEMLNTEHRGEPFTQRQQWAIKTLWFDAGVQLCYQRRSEFQLADSTRYFLDELDRIGQPAFVASVQDVLMMRTQTTSVSETIFKLDNVFWRVFDVGGQRTERRKWLHYFDDVNAIIFIVAVSEYDQKLREDGQTNRLQDAITLFKLICNSIFFQETSIVLFLNKKDLFARKIKRTPLNVLFSDYTGEQTYQAAMAFLKTTFEKLNERQQSRQIYSHETCATDTNQVELVLNNVTEMIIKVNMRDSGSE